MREGAFGLYMAMWTDIKEHTYFKIGLYSVNFKLYLIRKNLQKSVDYLGEP